MGAKRDLAGHDDEVVIGPGGGPAGEELDSRRACEVPGAAEVRRVCRVLDTKFLWYALRACMPRRLSNSKQRLEKPAAQLPWHKPQRTSHPGLNGVLDAGHVASVKFFARTEYLLMHTRRQLSRACARAVRSWVRHRRAPPLPAGRIT